MLTTETMGIMQQAITLAIRLAAPLLLASLGVGLLIAILQAATQIQEQTMTFVPKLLLIGLILFATGNWMLQTLSDFFMRVFELMLM